ncbi:MAG TPA: cache domain-containing protein [Syntrophorhabdaceae bacterium]|jgi:signal transduction histidine kinase
MLTSFRSKLLLLIITILTVSSAAIMAFTVVEVTETMSRTTRQAARDQLRLVKLDIENEHRSIVYHKEYALLRYKEQLKNLTALALTHIDGYYALYRAGSLTEGEAKRLAAESLRNFKFGNNDYFFVYDLKGMNISHPDPALYGKDLSLFRDVKGKYAVRDIIRTALTKGSGFDSFWYIRLGEKEPAEKLSYVELYKKWNWVVGTGVYIDDITRDMNMKIERVVKGLEETMGRMRIGQTGYFFLFNGQKKMLLHPALKGKEAAQVNDPARVILHYDELIKASKNPGLPLIYLWDKPSGHEGDFRFLKEAYVDYFPPLDWYVAASVYRDEIDRPARVLVGWQIVFTVTGPYCKLYYDPFPGKENDGKSQSPRLLCATTLLYGFHRHP